MRFMHPERDELLELSLDDVFLLPNYFAGPSRTDVDLTPSDFRGGSHPIVSANMNAVTGKRMAETMARFGGLGVLPQDMELHTVERIVRHIKAADPRYDTILDSALFHIFDDADRPKYVASLHGAVLPGGIVHVLALSDQGRGFGPQVSGETIRDAFGDGLELEALEPATYRGVVTEVHADAFGLPIGSRVDEPAWLARARRL